MIDFKLSDKGDLILQRKVEMPAIKLSFHTSRYLGFHLSFEQGYEYRRTETDGFKLRFNTQNEDIQSPTSFASVTDMDEIRQNLMIALRTEQGEIRTLPSIGSHVYQLKHTNLNLSSQQHAIEAEIKSDVEQILDGTIQVVATPEKRGNNAFYCQNMTVYIFQDGNMIYSFDIKAVQ